MAKETGLSQSSVSRIWRAFGLQPHRSETFKLSTDPYFLDKVHDVVGLYLDPPERALVFCVDEKSQIQALDRSQPVLPMMPGVPQLLTHDYVRAGTTTLFAALDIATGKVIGSLHRRHRAEEFKKFLIKLDQQVPPDLDIHLVLDNYATHKTPAVKTWLLAHPRFHLHFTPTGSSWLNLVERWFAELTTKQLRRGVHKTVHALEADIRTWIATWNTDPKPYVWTRTANEILDRLASYLNRGRGRPPVRLQAERPPDPRHGRLREPHLSGHRPRRPVSGVVRRGLQRPGDHRGDLFVGDRPRAARARHVAQPGDPVLDEPGPPPAHRMRCRAERSRHLCVRCPARAGQNDPAPQRPRLRGGPAPHPSLQRDPLLLRQDQLGLGPPSPRHPLTLHI